MKKLGLFMVLLIGMAFAGASSYSQELPSLPDDPRISYGKLPDGISYYIVANPSLKGYADFALVRKSCPRDISVAQLDTLPRFKRSPDSFLRSADIHYGPHGYVRTSGDGNIVNFSNVMLTSGTERIDSLLLVIFDMIDDRKSPADEAIVISGDVDPAQMAYRIKLISLMIPAYGTSSGDTPVQPDARGPQDCQDVAAVSAAGPGVVSLSFICRTDPLPESYMGTVLPAVTARLADELGFVLRRRLAAAFSAAGVVPVSIDMSRKGRTEGLSEEIYSLDVTVPSGCAVAAAEAVGSVLSSLDCGGISPEEYSQAASAFSRSLYGRIAGSRVPNSEYVDRCADAFLYGTDLASARERYDFFSGKIIRDTTGARLLGRFASELIDSSVCLSFSMPEGMPAAGVEDAYRAGWSMGRSDVQSPQPVPVSDTLAFPGPGEKCAVRLSRNDRVLGARLWLFANGLKVAYRKMDTGGLMYYSYVLKGGYAMMRDMKNGEGAFLPDMLSLCRIAGMDNADFKDMLAVNGITMDTEVDLNSISVSGSLPEGKMTLFLKSLLALSKSRTLDTASVRSYLAAERLRLASPSASRERTLYVIDSLMCGDYRYSAFRSPYNLHDDLPERAMEFFDSRFFRSDDGILVLVGNIPEEKMKKLLQVYAGGFRTIGRRAVKPAISYRMVSGESTYFVNGDTPGIDIMMSADLSLNSDNYMASRIAVMALNDAMAAAVHDAGMYVKVKDAFSTYPLERFSVFLSAAYASEAGIAGSVQKDKLVMALLRLRLALSELSSKGIDDARLDMYKAVLASRWDALQSSPGYWVSMITGRFEGGKDMQSKYADRINAVTKEDVLRIIRRLDEGTKVEYITKEK